MTIARYRKIANHPAWLYNVELIVIVNGKRITIAEFNCTNERDLHYATECCDYVISSDMEV
jgi:hypothetical protein